MKEASQEMEATHNPGAGGQELETQSMEAVSVTDTIHQSTDMDALLKKIDYDPYNEDEVSIC